jgi:penicillin amidase
LLQHALYSRIPLLDWVSDLSAPASGDFYTLDRGGGYEVPSDQPFARTQGAGFRGVYDLADPDKSRFIIATGQSGHILSPHYRDFVAPWFDMKSITLAGSEAELKRAGAQEFIFTPQ